MKQLGIIVLSILVLFALGCNQQKTVSKVEQEVKLDNEKAKASYSIGVNMSSNLKKVKSEVEMAALIQGLKDGLEDDESKIKMNKEEMQKVLQTFSKKAQAIIMAEKKIASEKNIVEGAAFLAENAIKEGVISTASGLQYTVLKEGKGETPKPTDKVKVHYTGSLINGTVFDSSLKKNKPAEFFLNRVFKGWTEGVTLMKTGAKYKFFIPSELAYGERGNQVIGPNATLIFEIELLEILPPAAPKKPATDSKKK